MGGFTLGMIVGGVIGGLVYLAKVSLSQHRRPTPGNRRKTTPKGILNAETIGEGAKIPLGSQVYIGDVFYQVEGCDQHFEVEDGSVSYDDYWWVYTLTDIETNKTLYLCVVLDDEDRWEFWVYEDIKDQLWELEDFSKLDFSNKSIRPPKSFSFKKIDWKVKKDCFDYVSHVRSERVDRERVSKYKTRETEYQQYLPGGRKGNKTLCIEFWDGGINASTGHKYTGPIRLP